MSTTRPPRVYRGNPFVVEVGLAYGGDLPVDEPAEIMRFANRVPLQYQPKACAISESVYQTNWRGYELQQPKGSLPVAPMAIVVHLASVWVPFTSEAKEAVAHYDELLREMKLAVQECGRKLGGAHPGARARASASTKRRSLFERYIPEVAHGDRRTSSACPRTRSRSRSTTALPNFVTFAGRAGRRRRRRRAPRRRRRAAEAPRPRRRRRRRHAAGAAGEGQARKRATAARTSGEQLSLHGVTHGRQEDRRRRPTRQEEDRRDAHDAVEDREARAERRWREATKGKNPAVEIRTRALSNVSFNEKKKIIELGDKTQSREFFNTAMARKFMQTMLVASGCKTLIDEGKTVSIRQMFYMTKHTLPRLDARTPSRTRTRATRSSRTSRSASTRCARSCTSSPTGAGMRRRQAGHRRRGRPHRPRAHGPRRLEHPEHLRAGRIKFVESKAEFILFVEKDAVCTRLNEDRFWKKHNCILMTSEGQATRGARRLLQRMATELKLPIYVLVDNDPWGLYIYSVLKQGSINLAYESMRMAVPNVRFLGMSAFDYKKFKLTPGGARSS